MILLYNRTTAPVAPLWKGRETMSSLPGIPALFCSKRQYSKENNFF